MKNNFIEFYIMVISIKMVNKIHIIILGNFITLCGILLYTGFISDLDHRLFRNENVNERELRREFRQVMSNALLTSTITYYLLKL